MGKLGQSSRNAGAGRFLRAVSLALLLASCKSPSISADEPKPSPVPSAAPSPEAAAAATPTADPLALDVTLSTREPKDGGLVELFIKPTATVEPGSVKVVFEGMDYPVYENGEGRLGALVVVAFNSAPRETKIDLAWREKGSKKRRTTELPIRVVDGGYKSEVLKVQEDKINPPKRVVKRILAESKEIAALYRRHSPKRLWSGTFQLPIDSEITSPFGNKRLYNGSMKSFHQGLDLRARTPTPIHAPEGAVVVLAKDLYFTGDTVILDHGHGLFTVYGHMSRLDVKKGQEVKKGDVLGLSGASGRASGPHLHWGAVLLRQKFNPQDLVQVLR
jgi:murein DD-endopeptidase MepM/ murein hydrolase activator NlpD